MRPALLALLGLALATPVQAMDYALDSATAESRFLYARGTIEEGDAKRFATFLTGLPTWQGKTFVVLDSPGGLVHEALSLGAMIERHKFMTGIAPNARCTSACVLLWAAGSLKMTNPGACIGVHNAWMEADPKEPKLPKAAEEAVRKNIEGTATLTMASWLFDHGAPVSVTNKLLHTPSSQMTCLTPEDLAAWSVRTIKLDPRGKEGP